MFSYAHVCATAKKFCDFRVNFALFVCYVDEPLFAINNDVLSSCSFFKLENLNGTCTVLVT